VELNESLVRRLVSVVDAGLTSGLGEPIPGKMCVEAAICFALGEGHSDAPSCVEPAVRAGKIALNDKNWSSPAARAKGLRAVAIAQLGSLGVVGPVRYATLLAKKTIQRVIPIPFRDITERIPAHRDALLAAAERCEREGTREAVLGARRAADAAADAATATATAAAADAAADAATATATAAAAYAAECDRILSISAECMVEALRECGSPGCDWLWLLEERANG